MGRLHTPAGRADERLSTELEWKTSGPCNMDTVLLHLSATVFDGGVKCACVGLYVRARGRRSVWMWQRRSVEVVERKKSAGVWGERASLSKSVYRTQSHAKWLYWSLMFIKMALSNRRGEEKVIFSRLLLKFNQHFLNLFLSRRRWLSCLSLNFSTPRCQKFFKTWRKSSKVSGWFSTPSPAVQRIRVSSLLNDSWTWITHTFTLNNNCVLPTAPHLLIIQIWLHGVEISVSLSLYAI